MSGPTPRWPELPPHLATDPAMLDWRLRDHETRIARLEDKPAPTILDALPWGRIIGMAIMAILGLLGHVSPAELKALAQKLLGAG